MNEMKNIILDFMRNNDYGLLAFESPTGFGKTYSASEAIAEYSHEENSNRKKTRIISSLFLFLYYAKGNSILNVTSLKLAFAIAEIVPFVCNLPAQNTVAGVPVER